jgi:hypothetical protein
MLTELSQRGAAHDLQDGNVDLQLFKEPRPHFNGNERVDAKLDEGSLGVDFLVRELQHDLEFVRETFCRSPGGLWVSFPSSTI